MWRFSADDDSAKHPPGARDADTDSFAGLSLADARDTYHVHLGASRHVVATAVGRDLVRVLEVHLWALSALEQDGSGK